MGHFVKEDAQPESNDDEFFSSRHDIDKGDSADVTEPDWLSKSGPNDYAWPDRCSNTHAIPTHQGRKLTLGFLGMHTSSHGAALYYIQRDRLPSSTPTVPFRTFGEMLKGISNADGPAIDLAIVPAASQDINSFFMDPALRPAVAFPWATPPYGLAARSRRYLSPQSRIAYFEPTLPVLESMMADLKLNEYRAVKASDTENASALVARGEADFAVTNAHAVKIHGLVWAYRFIQIPMIWIGFSRKR